VSLFSGPVLAAAALLVLSAFPKWQRPDDTVAALRDIGFHRVPGVAGRVVALVEATVGTAVITFGGRPLEAATALLYLGFTVVLARGLRRGIRSCGCAGRADTPPTVGHLLLTATFTAFAVGAAATGAHVGLVGIGDSGHPASMVVVLVLAGFAAWFGWAVMSLLPRVAVSASRSARGLG
jgi:hypothetical protein